MFRSVSCALALGLLVTGAAQADCSADEATEAGKVVGQKARSAVTQVVTIEGKQMLNVEKCDFRGGNYDVAFRFNFMGSDGYYWIEGKGKFDNAGAGEVAITKASPNLQKAAEAKGATLLSSL